MFPGVRRRDAHPASSANIPKTVVVVIIIVVVEMSPTTCPPSFSRSIADLDVDAVNPMNAMSSIKLKSRMPAAFSDNPQRVWTSILLPLFFRVVVVVVLDVVVVKKELLPRDEIVLRDERVLVVGATFRACRRDRRAVA